jgi:hypothetical protein
MISFVAFADELQKIASRDSDTNPKQVAFRLGAPAIILGAAGAHIGARGEAKRTANLGGKLVNWMDIAYPGNKAEAAIPKNETILPTTNWGSEPLFSITPDGLKSQYFTESSLADLRRGKVRDAAKRYGKTGLLLGLTGGLGYHLLKNHRESK